MWLRCHPTWSYGLLATISIDAQSVHSVKHAYLTSLLRTASECSGRAGRAGAMSSFRRRGDNPQMLHKIKVLLDALDLRRVCCERNSTAQILLGRPEESPAILPSSSPGLRRQIPPLASLSTMLCLSDESISSHLQN